MQELSQWLLQESNVLRVKRVQHHRRGETEPREAYRIKDEFVYTIAIEQHQPSGKWEPFKLPSGDVLQLEITMLDPHIRVNLVKGAVPGEYTTPSNLTLADVYGVFTFKVDYKRRGLSYITEKVVVPIHPFRHNEYPRFITAAYPYYAGSFSVIVAFWIFSVLFLFYRDPKKVKTQ